MWQRLYNQLPEFARPTNPVMRYILAQSQPATTRRGRLLRFGLIAILVAFAIFVGWEIATNFGATPFDASNTPDKIYLVLFWPLVLIQLITRLAALGSTSGVVAAEVARGTWDTLKVTTEGAVLTMKSRWAAIFYRLRLLLLILLLARVVFVVVALYDLTAFQGHYLDLLLSGTTPFGQPDVSPAVLSIAGVLITAMGMTACLLAPFTALAFDAGIGMVIATVSRGKLLGLLGQIVLLALRIVVTGLALQIGAAALGLTQPGAWPSALIANSPVLAWLGALFGVAEGDMGLSLLFLTQIPHLWADLDYGALVGVAFLIYVLLQGALANALVKWAGRRAASAEAI
ncbi:MAG TPA: hypothetical protein VKQ72_07260 [Aggregatilineales bacterium]|nr:hypothetical protein [Aggregatilineales bacterium]